MSENVSVEMFKIWADSQNKLLTNLHQEMKDTNENIKKVVELVRTDVNTSKSILDQHIIEYNRDKQDYKVRFKNLFTRQDKIDGILIERAPAWFVFKSFRKAMLIFITAFIVAAASALGAIWYNK